MSFMEMLWGLMAVVFFTTVSMVYNRSMWTQAESLETAGQLIQATQLAHSRLDEIDARLFSKQVSFALRDPDNVVPTVEQAFTTALKGGITNLAYSGYKFNVIYNFKYCDSLGVDLTNQTYNSSALFIKMSLTIASTPGMKNPLTLSRLYARTNLYWDN
jgi:hypothetical protein